MDISPQENNFYGKPMDIVEDSHHFIKPSLSKTKKRGKKIIKNKASKGKKKRGKKADEKNVLKLNEKKRKEERKIIFNNARGLNEHHFIWISHGETLEPKMQNITHEQFPYKELLQYGIDGAFLATTDKNDTIPNKICNKDKQNDKTYRHTNLDVPIDEYMDETGQIIKKKLKWLTLPNYQFSVSATDEQNKIKGSMGLWYCKSRAKKIFHYNDILNKIKNGKKMNLYDVNALIASHCKNKKIPTNQVAVSIWACRVPCGETKAPVFNVNGGGKIKEIPTPMSSEDMAQFLNVCEMPTKKIPYNVKTKTRTQTKTRKNNKKATQTNS